VSSAAHIRAVPPPEAVAREGQHAPWLLITETCVTGNGRSVLFARDYHRGDVFAFHVVRRRVPDS
jgi:GntR family transcriptional regulator